MGHDITKADLGKRVKAVSVRGATTVTIEGPISSTDSDGRFWIGETLGINETYAPGSSGEKWDDWNLTIERIRPAVPTGLGAVVRLDGGGIACRCSQSGSDPWWYMPGEGLSNCPQSDDYIGGRLVEVIHEGVTP